jgi:RNA polymerase sigma-70 factor (ECF subfamily)
LAGQPGDSADARTAPRGGEEAVRAALGSAGPAVRRYLFGVCGDWHEAEDLAQAALLKAWRRRETFDGRASARTWIFAIARNHWRDRLRRKRSAPRMKEMIPDSTVAKPSAAPDAAAARDEFRRAVDRALERLPRPQREALALRESEGLTFADIAALLDVPVGTVKTRVRRALLKLADELSAFAPEDAR